MARETQFECSDCGYRGAKIEGGTMEDHLVNDPVLVHCEGCAAISTANQALNPLVCLQCGTTHVKPYRSLRGREMPSTPTRGCAEEGVYRCPKCKRHAVKLLRGRMFD